MLCVAESFNEPTATFPSLWIITVSPSAIEPYAVASIVGLLLTSPQVGAADVPPLINTRLRGAVVSTQQYQSGRTNLHADAQIQLSQLRVSSAAVFGKIPVFISSLRTIAGDWAVPATVPIDRLNIQRSYETFQRSVLSVAPLSVIPPPAAVASVGVLTLPSSIKSMSSTDNVVTVDCCSSTINCEIAGNRDIRHRASRS